MGNSGGHPEKEKKPVDITQVVDLLPNAVKVIVDIPQGTVVVDTITKEDSVEILLKPAKLQPYKQEKDNECK